MGDEPQRTADFAKDLAYEDLLRQLNDAWAELELGPSPTHPERPMLFIVGAPRSGTTLGYQLLASSRRFGFPSNIVARFHRNPALGLSVQALLEPLLPAPVQTWQSRAGWTQGWREPHEFTYFWNRHLCFGDHHQPSTESLSSLDPAPLRSELAAMEQAAGSALLFKNLVLDFAVPHLARVLPSARFLWVRRDPFDVSSSILRLRQEFHGDVRAWTSVRPRDFRAWSSLEPEDQVAHQLASIDAALESARGGLETSRWLTVDYRELCASPADFVQRACGLAGLESAECELAFEAFTPTSAPRQGASAARLVRALAERGLC